MATYTSAVGDWDYLNNIQIVPNTSAMPYTQQPMPSIQQQINQLKTQVEMLQGIIDGLQGEKKLLKQTILQFLKDDKSVQEYICSQLEELNENAKKTALEELAKKADMI